MYIVNMWESMRAWQQSRNRVTHHTTQPTTLCPHETSPAEIRCISAHSTGSLKSAMVEAQPASRSTSAVCVLVMPSVRTAAATAELAPEGESSMARHCFGLTHNRFMASKYGSGQGLPRSHSSPMTTVSNHSRRPMLPSICSALGRGAFVTAAHLMPSASSQLKSSSSPGVASDGSCSLASLRNRASLSAEKRAPSSSVHCGKRSLHICAF
mmetsp:Transcript_55505/g.91927  ORF Transcript_55505/g.91927 Transcript_55505/m.91927 type:complete len:211 (+) Transcript_55505:9-641(+)